METVFLNIFLVYMGKVKELAYAEPYFSVKHEIIRNIIYQKQVKFANPKYPAYTAIPKSRHAATANHEALPSDTGP